MTKITSLLNGTAHMSLWLWAIIAVAVSIALLALVNLFRSGTAEVGSGLFNKLFGSTFAAVGKHLGSFFYTKYGKWLTISTFLVIVGLGAWRMLTPAIETVIASTEQDSQDEIISRAYAHIPKTGKYVVMGNPYIHPSDDERIEAWRRDMGNMSCMYVHVTKPTEEKLATFLGVRSMEFRVCKNIENHWVYERTSVGCGALKSADDFSISMIQVVDVIAKNDFVPPSPKKVGLFKSLMKKVPFMKKNIQ